MRIYSFRFRLLLSNPPSPWASVLFNSMAPPTKTRSVPKFGEWDVNDPSSGEGFTEVFSRAKQEKRSDENVMAAQQRNIKNDNTYKPNYRGSKSKTNWLCCFRPEGVA